MQIVAQRLPHGEGLELPTHQTLGAAGLDMYAAIPAGTVLELVPGQTALVPCGFAIELPKGFEAQVRPRSGLAVKHSVTVLNSPGTIDSDYRGEVAAILINHGMFPFRIKRGDRIAQMVIARHETVELVLGEKLSPSARGVGAYGSTGVALEESK